MTIGSNIAVPSRRMIVVAAMIRTGAAVVTRRADIYADASWPCVNIHLRERRHRRRGNKRACGNGSKCELLRGISFFCRSVTLGKRIGTADRSELFGGVRPNVMEHLRRLRC
jgi:hypothetical protein